MDLAFAQALQRDLRAQGIRCWLFPDNARGNALVDRLSTSDQEEVERWVRDYDKLVVVCSQAALDSETVRNDITGAKERQQSEDRWLLFLAAPDDTVAQPRGRGLARDLELRARWCSTCGAGTRMQNHTGLRLPGWRRD